jgi:thiol:disulfide interchange protein DsbG
MLAKLLTESTRRGSRRALTGQFVLATLSMVATLSFGQTSGSKDPAPWERLEHATWVSEGSTHPKHIIYVITDTDCPFCHDLWLAFRPLYRQDLQVRNVMVGIISDVSPGKAAAILEAPVPARALEQNERRWARLPNDLGGGIPPLKSPKPATLAAIKANEQLMRDLGIRGTPGIIYRSQDHELHVLQSTPKGNALTAVVQAASD